MNLFVIDIFDLTGKPALGLTAAFYAPDGSPLGSAFSVTRNHIEYFSEVYDRLTLSLTDPDHAETMTQTVYPGGSGVVFNPERPFARLLGSQCSQTVDTLTWVSMPTLNMPYDLSQPVAIDFDRVQAGDILRVYGRVTREAGYNYGAFWFLNLNLGDSVVWGYARDCITSGSPIPRTVEFYADLSVQQKGAAGRLVTVGRVSQREEPSWYAYQYWKDVKNDFTQGDEVALPLAGILPLKCTWINTQKGTLPRFALLLFSVKWLRKGL